MTKKFAIAVLGISLLVGCAESPPDTLIATGFDKQEMENAIERSRSEADFFIAELSKSTGTHYSVKVPVEDNGAIEHFWLVDVDYKNGEFKGIINNEPGIVSNVKMGQSWTVKKADISDWMFMRDGKLHGNYTMRPLLEAMPKEEAEKYRSMFAVP